MARGTMEYNSGNIPGAGSGVIDALIGVLDTELTAYQSNSADAWEHADEISTTPSSFQVVYHSVGDRTLGSGSQAGDTDLWLKIYRSAAAQIDFIGYQDWGTGNHTGARASTTTQARWSSISDTAEIDWWRVSNEYEFVFVLVQSGGWRIVYFFSPIRIQGPKTNGVARVATETSTTGTVVVDLDRDISGAITPGQRVWIVNQTVAGQNVDSSAYAEIVEVSAVTSSTITLLLVANQPYRVGSLVGLDPCGFAIGEGSADPTLYWTNRPDAGYTAAASQVGAIEHLGALLSEASADPRVDNDYLGVDAVARSTQTSYLGLRGFCEAITYWAVGVQTSGDRMLPDHQTANAYKVFAALLHTGWAIGIGGPGAGVT